MTRVRKKKAPAPPLEPVKTVVYEGFGSRDARAVTRPYLCQVPGYVNSISLHRIRITVEVLEEPTEVLAERLQELWETLPYNVHHSDTFKRHASEYGIELPYETRGIRAPSKR